jgi:hypothetical protein
MMDISSKILNLGPYANRWSSLEAANGPFGQEMQACQGNHSHDSSCFSTFLPNDDIMIDWKDFKILSI